MSTRRELFTTVRTEGGLLPADLLARIAAGDPELPGLTPDAYHLHSGEKLNEAINRAWQRLLGAWEHFRTAAAPLPASEVLTGLTRDRWLLPLFSELGYGRLTPARDLTLDGASVPISHTYAATPIHLVGRGVDLDTRSRGVAGAARSSPHSLVQDFLNRSDAHLWGIVSNDRRLRLLRDSKRLTRQAYVEFDLEALFDGEIYADFVLLWLLCHQSRVEPREQRPERCWLEQWAQTAQQQGTRALDQLRAGVERAITALGSGFLRHPDNRELRARLQSGALTPQDYYRQLLRLVYRLLFLFVAEDRDLLLAPTASPTARQRYTDYYSTARLRRLAGRQRGTRHADLYRGLRVVMELLGGPHPQPLSQWERGEAGNGSAAPPLPSPPGRRAGDEVPPAAPPLPSPPGRRAGDEVPLAAPPLPSPPGRRAGDEVPPAAPPLPSPPGRRAGDEVPPAASLGLAPLGSFLWSRAALPDLTDAEIANADLLDAIRALAYTEEHGGRRPVDYKNLGAEELGSVYESLLELHPVLAASSGDFSLDTAGGHERKTTGSYYTPAALVSQLLDTALDPLLDEAARQPDPERAILALKVCDPACGSGHFLIAAAHRIAGRLAAIRTGDDEPAPAALRTALRDVIGHCLYGVDINEMAVELCKVALWMEALEPGKPLSFLDHHIQCGNSLLGTTPALLEDGLPDAAFEPITGDDEKTCAAYRQRNKQERAGQLGLPEPRYLWDRIDTLPAALAELDALPDETVADIQRKEARYAELVRSSPYEAGQLLADAWCAAFVWEKTPARVAARLEPVTTETLRRLARNPNTVDPLVRAEVQRLAGQYRFFHWHLAFPDVFRPHPNPSPSGRGALGADVLAERGAPTAPAGSGASGAGDRAVGSRTHGERVGERSSGDVTGWYGGFDVVLGNPPWERIKLQEQEWFAARAPEIAQAHNAAERKRRIERLKVDDPALYAAFQADLRQAEGESHLVRNGGRFPLCGRGDVNTYSVFAETMRLILGDTGRAGCIVPSGIATDDTTKHFFRDLMESRALVSLYDFENRDKLFPAVLSLMKFCLLTLTGPGRPSQGGAEFAFFLHDVEELRAEERRFSLSTADLALLNPNTRTCPIFRRRRDAELTKAIYRRVPVLIAEGPPERNPWGITFLRMLDMANNSGLFRTREELEQAGLRLVGNVFGGGEDLTPVPPLPMGEGAEGPAPAGHPPQPSPIPPLPMGEGAGGEVTSLIRGQAVDPAVLARARELRRQMTPAERALWEAVRDSRRGVRFRRQQVIGRFIADFYCDAARLVVEIDGDIHDQQADYDAARDRQMTALGLRVLRFRNDQVLTDLSAVLAEIDAAIQSGVSTRTAGEDLTPVPPLPAGEGGGGPAPAGQPPQPGAAPPLPMGEGAGGEVHLPLYEAKLLHQFDHRWATYAGAGARDLTAAEKADPHRAVLPRYWVPAAAVEARLRDRWDRRWLLGWRDICRSTDERTVIASLLPRAGVGHKFPLLLSDADACALSCLYANLNSFVLDYVARQKIGGTSLTYFYLKQFPILPPDTYAQPCPWAPAETLRDWIAARVLELVYTAWDLQPFARDCGYAGPPFRWDETRRFRLRCELDAAYFHLYGIARDGVEDIMDTFPIVRRKDEAAHGEYRTKRVILEVYDAMAAALAGGAPYRTVLDPPPADGWVAHPHPQPLSRPAGEGRAASTATRPLSLAEGEG